ncbi:hypothetical protein BDQ12DRAFT_726711 [Crucibulum laeve]|uniref:Uncharacterized protein n=1 Tax=Crucibulum laeve TaxID=68775 RepID=A0A5C3LP45_9AGAR|nr:hypothetical protein BDQ12DRAFT_726711 [Crucibulum laeve]
MSYKTERRILQPNITMDIHLNHPASSLPQLAYQLQEPQVRSLTSDVRQPNIHGVSPRDIYNPSNFLDVYSSSTHLCNSKKCLADDSALLRMKDTTEPSSLAPKYARMCFIFRLVFFLCTGNHKIAVETWLRLLGGASGDDIWMWAEGDEERIQTEYPELKRPFQPANRQTGRVGWRLTDQELATATTTLANRIEDKTLGDGSQSLFLEERRNRLQALRESSLRFAAIAWATATSQAMRDASNSLGLENRNYHSLLWELEETIYFPFATHESLISLRTPDHPYHAFADAMLATNHVCHQNFCNKDLLMKWIYVGSLASPGERHEVVCLTPHKKASCPACRSVYGPPGVTVEVQSTPNLTQPPASYLIFLWIFWYKFGRQLHDEPESSVDPVFQWLKWLGDVSSRESTAYVLEAAMLPDVKAWLDAICHRVDSSDFQMQEFAVWVYSYPPSWRAAITRVCDNDWTKAAYIVEASAAKASTGSILLGPELSPLDIRGWLGALALLSFRDLDCGRSLGAAERFEKLELRNLEAAMDLESFPLVAGGPFNWYRATMAFLSRSGADTPISPRNTGNDVEILDVGVAILSPVKKKVVIDLTVSNEGKHTKLSADKPKVSSRIMGSRLPKATMVKEIKEHFIKLLEHIGVVIGGVKIKQLPWKTLVDTLASHGMELENWPKEVPLPGSCTEACDDNRGVNGLDLKMLTLLHESVKSENFPVGFRRIRDGPQKTSTTVFAASNTIDDVDPYLIMPPAIDTTRLLNHGVSLKRRRDSRDLGGINFDKRQRSLPNDHMRHT